MIIWISFLALITIFLAIDLGVFNREAHEISYKEATKWTVGWTTLGLLFAGVIYLIYSNGMMVSPTHASPTQSAIEYLTG